MPSTFFPKRVDIRDASEPKNARLSIDDLPNDLLWNIFLLNADMKDDIQDVDSYYEDRFGPSHPLNVARFSSQVCRTWRNIILGSSSLWGRLIDLDYFPHLQRGRRDEIMHRSGESPLWIQGTVDGGDTEARLFFLSLLSDHWSRIERLAVKIRRAKHFPACMWDVLRRPSERIEKFHFSIQDHNSNSTIIPTTADDPRDLFLGHAPRLRDFRCERVTFNHQASWLSNIRRLDVKSPYATKLLAIVEWLDVLRQMPSLENLSLINPFSSEDQTTSQLVANLPNLQEIKLVDDLIQSSIFLEYLIPKVGCCLEWLTRDKKDSTHWTELELGLGRRVISKYSQGWFNNRVVRSLGFAVFYSSFRVHEYPRHSLSRLPSFEFDIHCASFFNLPIILRLLAADAFSSCNFDNITTLHFLAEFPNHQGLTLDVHDFLMLLPAVDTLFTNAKSLGELVSLRDVVRVSKGEHLSSHPIFPLLRVIKLQRLRSDFFDHGSKRPSEAILPFFAWRKEVNRPVQILDLTNCQDFEDPIDFLEEVSGLKVIWNKEGLKEYTCGSGNPDELRSGWGYH